MNPIDYTAVCLTMWREARGEPAEGRLGVLHVILNRVRDPRWPNTPYGVCFQPAQFSCNSPGDVNATLWPQERVAADWRAWQEIQAMVSNPGADPTLGATNYCTIKAPASAKQWPPSWAAKLTETARLGGHVFYR